MPVATPICSRVSASRPAKRSRRPVTGSLTTIHQAARRTVRRLGERQRLRRRPPSETATGVDTVIDGRAVWSFCSNDYLGLASHPLVIAALQAGAQRWGAGGGASQMISGYTTAHRALEQTLAEWLGCERALVFSSGYLANLGVMSALVGRGEQVVQDRLNHASLLDAARYAGARLSRYDHADPGHLALRLRQAPETVLIASDGVFSMDGDVAPLPQLLAQAEAGGQLTLIDDAHGLGVLGAEGRGSAEYHGLEIHRFGLWVVTFGKALGSCGACVLGDADLLEAVSQAARTLIYTTAPPAAQIEATRASLRLCMEDAGPRQRLQAHVERFQNEARRRGLPVSPSPTPIQPLLVGADDAALRWSAALLQRGFWVSAIRPPTVPEGGARLRITLSAAHQEAQVDALLDALEEIAADEGARRGVPL